MAKLEPMASFFDSRLADYDNHMLCDIAGAEAFYSLTAKLLPTQSNATVLDLGCGTGLELQWYFENNPTAQITGIDLATGMLQKLREKFPGKELHLICGNYFEVPFPGGYDAAVSVESLHHFTKEEKIVLYTKLWNALKENGYFVLTDYFSQDEMQEQMYRKTLQEMKKEQGLDAQQLYHYDTPLTVPNEIEALRQAGFQTVEIINHWGATYTLKAIKGEEK